MLCYAVTVALLPKFSRMILRCTINKKCWSAEFLDALHGLDRSGDFQHRERTFQMIPQSECVVDVRKRFRSTWNQADQLGNEDQGCSFPVSLHANVFFEVSICRLVSRLTTGTQNYCQSDWSFLFLPGLF